MMSLKEGSVVYTPATSQIHEVWIEAKVLRITSVYPKQKFQIQLQEVLGTKRRTTKEVSKSHMAIFHHPEDYDYKVGSRVIANYVGEAEIRVRKFASVVAELPEPGNGERYLVFFDDGDVRYVNHQDLRPVYSASTNVWKEVRTSEASFIKEYLRSPPPLKNLHVGQDIVLLWRGEQFPVCVEQVDASLVEVRFPTGETAWVYRGSPRITPVFKCGVNSCDFTSEVEQDMDEHQHTHFFGGFNCWFCKSPVDTTTLNLHSEEQCNSNGNPLPPSQVKEEPREWSGYSPPLYASSPESYSPFPTSPEDPERTNMETPIRVILRLVRVGVQWAVRL